MSSVVISYRRDDSGGHAGRRYDRMRAEPEFRNGGIPRGGRNAYTTRCALSRSISAAL